MADEKDPEVQAAAATAAAAAASPQDGAREEGEEEDEDDDRCVLYSNVLGPNPRRVLVFAAEQGLSDVFRVQETEMTKIKTPEFLAVNAAGQLPALRLPTGETIAESVAICRYLETVYGDAGKPSMFGDSPLEVALVEQWQRRIELQLFMGGIGRIWIHNPILRKFAKKVKITQRQSERDMGQRTTDRILKMVDEQLGKTQAFVAGDRVTIPDVTLLCALDFGAGLAGLKYKASEFPNVTAWRERMNERDSVKAFPDPYTSRKFAAARTADGALTFVRRMTSMV